MLIDLLSIIFLILLVNTIANVIRNVELVQQQQLNFAEKKVEATYEENDGIWYAWINMDNQIIFVGQDKDKDKVEQQVVARIEQIFNLPVVKLNQ